MYATRGLSPSLPEFYSLDMSGFLVSYRAKKKFWLVLNTEPWYGMRVVLVSDAAKAGALNLVRRTTKHINLCGPLFPASPTTSPFHCFCGWLQRCP